jgi:hypothetical protein
VPALSRSSGSPAGRIKLTPGQCRSPSTAAPGQGPRRDTEAPGGVACNKSISATCSAKHPSADRYCTGSRCYLM